MNQSKGIPDQHPLQTISILPQTKITQSPSDLCAQWKDGWLNYDFSRCLLYLEAAGKEMFGERFRIIQVDHRLIYKLLVYMIGDREGASRQGLSLDKGILLTGPVGCGKTSLMKLLRMFMPSRHRFAVKSCREIGFEFAKGGYEVISYYSSVNNTAGYQRTPIYCFDDLGLEPGGKFYGNECNVMAEILLSRYDRFVSHGQITHGTTNLNSIEIEHIYGNRVRSRMREMFNLIAFPANSEDKRA